MISRNRNLRQRLLSGLRWPATLAPAILGISLTGTAHAQVVLSTDQGTYTVNSSTTNLTIESGVHIQGGNTGIDAESSVPAGLIVDNNGTIT